MARLDVAMFNAILRESGDEIPTDPVSDPITDSNVLPIPAGKSSFGAGALLKNAVSYSSSISQTFITGFLIIVIVLYLFYILFLMVGHINY